jgi:hypothetical protein
MKFNENGMYTFDTATHFSATQDVTEFIVFRHGVDENGLLIYSLFEFVKIKMCWRGGGPHQPEVAGGIQGFTVAPYRIAY